LDVFKVSTSKSSAKFLLEIFTLESVVKFLGLEVVRRRRSVIFVREVGWCRRSGDRKNWLDLSKGGKHRV
jgi:hypothetical protein